MQKKRITVPCPTEEVEQTYLGKASLSKQETIKGWKYEHIDGLSRTAASLKLNVSEQTLYRMYKHYGLSSPKRGK